MIATKPRIDILILCLLASIPLALTYVLDLLAFICIWQLFLQEDLENGQDPRPDENLTQLLRYHILFHFSYYIGSSCNAAYD